jgi:hypothetical protein
VGQGFFFDFWGQGWQPYLFGRFQLIAPVLLIVEDIHYGYNPLTLVNCIKNEIIRIFNVPPAKTHPLVDNPKPLRHGRQVVRRISDGFNYPCRGYSIGQPL